jgi:hypothetical protein
MVFKLIYWLVVTLISLALVVALVLFLESRDQSSVDRDEASAPALSWR